MFIVLSYASEQRDIAEQIKLALTASDHKVFFDRDSLPPGDDYHSRIRKAVQDSDAFIFLISPHSIAQGGYTLTELKYAREKWPEPKQKVLPVMIEKTDYSQIPPYLKAVKVLEPSGSAPAEVTAVIEEWQGGSVIDDRLTAGTFGARFLAVLAGPRSLLREVDHHSDHAFIGASLFAAFISVVNLIINIPVYRLANIQADSFTYGLIDTVITFVFWFLYGSIYHLGAKLFGGLGTYQSSIVMFLYLTAFTVIAGIFTLPMSLKAISWSLGSSDVPSVSEWQALGEQILESPTGLICTFLSSSVLTYRWICTIAVFMLIHKVSLAKGILIGVFSGGISLLLTLTLEKHAVALLWRGFLS